MSALGLDNNWRILKMILNSHVDFVAVEFTLRRDGDEEAAEEISDKIRKLEKRIRKLRGRITDDWSDKSPGLRDDVRTIARDVRAAVEDVEDDVSRSEKIAAAMSYIDDMLAIVDQVIK